MKRAKSWPLQLSYSEATCYQFLQRTTEFSHYIICSQIYPLLLLLCSLIEMVVPRLPFPLRFSWGLSNGRHWQETGVDFYMLFPVWRSVTLHSSQQNHSHHLQQTVHHYPVKVAWKRNVVSILQPHSKHPKKRQMCSWRRELMAALKSWISNWETS